MQWKSFKRLHKFSIGFWQNLFKEGWLNPVNLIYNSVTQNDLALFINSVN